MPALSCTPVAIISSHVPGTFFYAGIFLIEGLGLMHGKIWAEYFTIIATASFVPVEVYLTAQHLSAARVLTTLVSIGIVWYLVANRMGERKRKTVLCSPSALS
jgi:uncharacterized membrane protein (DUF2068 family)